MALFEITTKRKKITNGVYYEPGMSVKVAWVGGNILGSSDGRNLICDAFMRTYGVDLRKAMALNTSDLDIKKL
ncbi:MAG: DUF6140 family protein [Bacteroidales bacterium]|nr:DUF6140 family protein [Bacteroidales bacterium]